MRERLALLACLLGALLGAAPAGAVVGGEQTTIDEVPWQVGLRITIGTQGYLCGGSIVDATHVVTAAHCTQSSAGTTLAPSAFRVVAGSSNQPWSTPTEGSQQVAVSAVAVHPQYSAQTQAHDAAVLTLAEPLDLTSPRARAISLGGDAQLALWDGADGDTALVSGWGATNPDGTAISPKVKRATIPVLADGSRTTPGTCAGAWQGGYLADVMLCGSTATEDTCSGDSGGPAVVREGTTAVLAGITSFGGELCADPSAPGVYTEVAGVRTFLQPAAAPPQRESDPVLSGVAQVGETVTCDPGAWTGEPTFAFELLRVDVVPAVALPSGGATSYELRPDDAGTTVACRVTATNSAGTATATSAPLGRVAAAAPAPQPAPAPAAPAPAPAPPPAPRPPAPDRTAPVARLVRRRCTATRCSFRVTATDARPSSGLRRVEVRLRRTMRIRCRRTGRRTGRRTRCARSMIAVLRPRSAGPRRWTVVAARSRAGSSQLVVVARDVAGNRQVRPARRGVPRRR